MWKTFNLSQNALETREKNAKEFKRIRTNSEDYKTDEIKNLKKKLDA